MIEGIAALGLSIYWLLCYVHLGQKNQPSRQEIIQLLQIADLVNTEINRTAQNNELKTHYGCH